MKFVPFDYPEDPGEARPFRIFAALLHRTLGDFTDQLLFAASLKEMLGSARLDIHYKPDRPYKQDIVSLAPQVDSAWPTNNKMPIDLFDTAGLRPIVGPEIWHDAGFDSPDLVLTPSMCPRERLGAFPQLARFRIPEADRWEHTLRDRATEDGFCVLHYREGGYEFSGHGAYRNVDAADIEPVVDFVLAQGLRVVRIGHAGMTPLAPRDGLTDLCDAPFLLQACAISRARFFLEVSPSGPSALANGFGVPMIRCNAIILAGPATPESIVLARPILDPDGRDVTARAAEQGYSRALFIEENNGYTLGRNSIEDIDACIVEMLRTTGAVTSWREPAPVEPASREYRLTWPLAKKARHRLAT